MLPNRLPPSAPLPKREPPSEPPPNREPPSEVDENREPPNADEPPNAEPPRWTLLKRVSLPTDELRPSVAWLNALLLKDERPNAELPAAECPREELNAVEPLRLKAFMLLVEPTLERDDPALPAKERELPEPTLVEALPREPAKELNPPDVPRDAALEPRDDGPLRLAPKECQLPSAADAERAPNEEDEPERLALIPLALPERPAP